LRFINGMKTQRTIGALIASTLLFAAPMHADSVSAQMNVSVQVLARAVVAVDSAPASVEVTASDITRGYVELDSPVMVRVRTNSRRGYVLQVNNVSETFSRVELSTSTMSMSVAQESWIERPYVAGGDVMPVHARLHLAPGTLPGSYALPVAFSATPL
jgi:hypothetical protein